MHRILSVIVVLGVASIVGVRLSPFGKVRLADPAVHTVEDGNLCYTFHVLTGTEALFDLRTDPDRLRNLTLTMPQTTAVLRGRLLRRLGVGGLEELRNPDDPTYKSLRGLGYLR